MTDAPESSPDAAPSPSEGETVGGPVSDRVPGSKADPDKTAAPVPESQGDRRAIISWCLFDFANSAFPTLIVTFVFSAYFTETVAPNKIVGTQLWTQSVSLCAIFIALLSPIMGAIADRGGYRKLLLGVMSAIAIVCAAGLFFVKPGEPTDAELSLFEALSTGDVLLGLFLFVIGNTAFEVSSVFYNAFLPDIAPPSKIGRISGYGWGLGYIGGLLAMVISLVLIMNADSLGITTDKAFHVRLTNLIVATWYFVFSIPIFLYVKEDTSQVVKEEGSIIAAAFRQFFTTFKEIRGYREIMIFLLARLLYNDGLVTIFNLGAVFAAGVHGFSTNELLLFGVVLNITAAAGAFGLGFLDDKLGGKTTILLSIVALGVFSVAAVLASEKWMMWVAGAFVGVFSGPNQSASRSLMGRLVPPDKENEFFGFFAFSGKATAFLGPFLVGTLTAVFESQRAGMAIVVLFFIAGGALLTLVDEEAGIKRAGRPG